MEVSDRTRSRDDLRQVKGTRKIGKSGKQEGQEGRTEVNVQICSRGREVMEGYDREKAHPCIIHVCATFLFLTMWLGDCMHPVRERKKGENGRLPVVH